MSQENVELIRSAIEALRAAGADAFLEFMTEDVEVYPDVSRFPEAKPFRGREEFRRFFVEIDQGWEGDSRLSEIREIFPAGDQVVARADWGGRGQASGLDLHSNLSAIYTVRDGQITKIEFFFDHTQGLEAAGLSE